MGRVVLVSPPSVFRDAFLLLLGKWGFTCVAMATDPARGASLIDFIPHDVAVVDVELSAAGEGVGLARQLVEGDSARPLLLLTGARDERLLDRVLGVGARGVVTKEATAPEVHDALDAVAAGRSYVDGRLGARFAPDPNPRRLLSEREREVLGLLAEGWSGTAVASRLFISAETVRTHAQNAMEKLGARTRSHAVALALGRGEIPAPPQPSSRTAPGSR
jgi:DNA-binding NarL/FixJ family response regulator